MKTISISLLIAGLMFHSLPSRADPIDFDRCSDQLGEFELQKFIPISQGKGDVGKMRFIEKSSGKATELFCGIDKDPSHAIEIACASDRSEPVIRVRVYREYEPEFPRAALVEIDGRFIAMACGSAAKVERPVLLKAAADPCDDLCSGLIDQWGHGICMDQCRNSGRRPEGPKIPFNGLAATLDREVTGYGKEEITTNCWGSGDDLRPYAKKAADQDAEKKCGSKAIRIGEYDLSYDFYAREHGTCTSVTMAKAQYRCETAQ